MGNKRQFNDEDILRTVSTHFWKHGYSATKVDQLSTATGLTKTSLYNAFGNKEALFIHSINFYVENFRKELVGSLDTKKALSKNIETVFNNIFNQRTNEYLNYGCFLTNSIVELNSTEPKLHKHITQLFDQTRAVMHTFFSTYTREGRIVPGYSANELTDLYMTFLQGLRVQSRNRTSDIALKNSIKTFLKFIKSIEQN